MLQSFRMSVQYIACAQNARITSKVHLVVPGWTTSHSAHCNHISANKIYVSCTVMTEEATVYQHSASRALNDVTIPSLYCPQNQSHTRIRWHKARQERMTTIVHPESVIKTSPLVFNTSHVFWGGVQDFTYLMKCLISQEIQNRDQILYHASSQRIYLHQPQALI